MVNRSSLLLLVALVVGFVLAKVARLLAGDGGLDAPAIALAALIATVIAFRWDPHLKRPQR
jgi:multisubunit Na+/H+ antiporter MnhB subunit